MTRTETRRFFKRRRTVAIVIALVAVAALAATAATMRPWTLIGRMTADGHLSAQSVGQSAGSARASTRSSARKVDVTTLRAQPVTSGVLNAEIRLGATLTYDTASDFAEATGIITQLPVAGKQIGTGEQVYEMDGVPVVLFHGERPFWRTLDTGVTDGPDVAQLEQNLAELGYFWGAPDNHFDGYTKEAVRQWQRWSLGLDGDVASGVFQPSSVAVAPAAPIRIKTVAAKLGQTNVSPATYTGVTLHAQATITAGQAATFKAGDKAKVVLPDNTTLDTTLTAVDQGGQSSGASTGQSSGQSAGKDGQVTQPSVRIDFPDQTQVAKFGPTAVQIIVPNADASNEETLIVPVTALIASAGDTYAVEVIRGDALERVTVEIGLVANAQVQILKADGLKVGDRVVIS
ncbi:peptidoglycan-binding protein [Bifidobacterium myosotis]|uniref:Peptidoglycan-binding protein n=1 Tax=Bifidobacterium myosotis TaxID=1630166 RepID=A0A261FET0_9BIFI|nr:peptidoglycan-binding domain-containing protein [Bifidobacterium myosotis]OZG57473.1 peptidoglycan-binding protein [Bifidobacterium myosotis]